MRILIILFMTLTLLAPTKHALAKTQSPFDYFIAERTFLADYVLDEDGGFSFWVNKDGTTVDARKFSLFQANIILWLGGLNSQHPDQENLELIRSAADYLVDHLYLGSGKWARLFDPTTEKLESFFWNPRNEVYIAYALMTAYEHTQDSRYLVPALETTKRQRTLNPTGVLLDDYGTAQDIGFRFPEHTAHLKEYRITGNEDALAYAHLFDETYRNRYAKETQTDAVGDPLTYYHGIAILDKLVFAYLTQSSDAYEEATTLRHAYWYMGHDDAKMFDTDALGEISDNGRDYYDKRLAMDVVEWSHTATKDFADDAIQQWANILRFWDYAEPFGFYTNTSQERKTCFSIGQPALLMDLTAPTVLSIEVETKAFLNHQVNVVVSDPWYQWNELNLRGIGIEESGLRYRSPGSVQYASVIQKDESCESCVRYQFNVAGFLSDHSFVVIPDRFGNTTSHSISQQTKLSLFNFSDLNNASRLYYLFIFLVFALFLTMTIVGIKVFRRLGH